MAFMNRREFVDAVGARLGDEELAGRAVAAFLDTITATVATGERVELPGFGAFSRALRPARDYRDPKTGVRGRVPATYVPKFKAGASFKSMAAGRRQA